MVNESRGDERVYINVNLLCDYAMWRFRTTGVKGETIKADISGINTFLGFHGYGINLHHGNSEPLVRIYRGVNRLRRIYEIGSVSVFRRAMVIEMLNIILLQLKLDDKFMRVMRAVILFGYHTGLRSHNYVQASKPGCAKLHNIKFYPDVDNPTHLLVHLPHAKTHQLDVVSAESRVLKCVCRKGDLCAVHEVAALINKRYKRSKHRYRALFLLSNRAPVTYKHLNVTMKLLSNLFSLNPRYYTPHCLRIGLATARHRQGWTLPAIMKEMGWTSRKSAMRYIRPNNPDFVYFNCV